MNTSRTIALPIHTPSLRHASQAKRLYLWAFSIQQRSGKKPSKTHRWLGLYLSIATLFINAHAYAISGGTPSAEPWAVEIVGLDNNQVEYLCVGAAINDHTIITATHCSADAISFADRTVKVQSRHDIKNTEVTLLFLTSPYALRSYAKLGPNYLNTPNALLTGSIGAVYGYGGDYLGHQQMASLSVFHHGETSNGREVLSMAPRGFGVLQSGDSGSPLIINGYFVGVLEGPSEAIPGQMVFNGLSPALDRIAQLIYERKARQTIASDL